MRKKKESLIRKGVCLSASAIDRLTKEASERNLDFSPYVRTILARLGYK